MKKVLVVLLATVLLFGFAANAHADGFDFGNLFGSLYGGSSLIPQNISMPEQFSITYEYLDSGRFMQVCMEKDAAGNYHYVDNDDEYLFVKDGKGYRIAVSTVNGFTYKNDEKYTFDYIQDLTSKFWELATPAIDEFTMGAATSEGEGVVCGRKTDKVKIDMGMGFSFGGYNVSMSEAMYFDFDQETGICLASSSSEDVSVFGINAGDGDQDGFECIEFELGNVTLPAVN